jgi:myo-inositol-1(or 4)-monophosphatase
MYYVITGSFKSYVDTNGGFIWDILPGLNLALENNCEVYVEGKKYNGEFLAPNKRYKLEILNK